MTTLETTIYRLNQKITRLESLIESGHARFNGYKEEGSAEAALAELYAERAELQPDIEKLEAEKAATAEAKRLERIAKARSASRNTKNAFLREHGYKWQKSFTGDIHQEINSWEWELIAPDGITVVTVEQAFDEIERGADVVRAEIAAAKAEAEAKEQAEAQAAQVAAEAKTAADTKAEAEFQTAVTNATANLTRTSDRFDTLGLTPIARHGFRTLLGGKIDGQRVAVVETSMYDGEYYAYWSENGTPKPPHFLDDFFG